MVVLLSLLLACSSAPPTQESPAPAPVEPSSKAAGGSIGGEPILPTPVVIGGIANEVVEQGILSHMASINACYEAQLASNPKLAGKVLVKFQIGMDGSVANALTRSTSLRNQSAEACLIAELSKVVFPPLERGRLAIVHYPFSFPESSR